MRANQISRETLPRFLGHRGAVALCPEKTIMAKERIVKLSETENIDINNGYVYDLQGNQTRKLTATDDGTKLALSDYAARCYYGNAAAQFGAPQLMRDSDGKEFRVNMDLSQSDVHTDGPLPNYAAGYKLAEGIADLASPVIVVDKASNKFNTWDAANAFRQVIPIGDAPGGAVPEINPTLSQSNYATVSYALGAFVSSEVTANADSPLRPMQAAVRRVMSALLLAREIRVATLLTTTANFDSSVYNTLGAAYKWNGGASSDPVADIHLAQESSQMPITHMAMSERTFHAFVRNASVKSYIQYKDGVSPMPTPGEVSSLLALPKILIAPMKYQAGSTNAMTYVWGNDVALFRGLPSLPMDQEDVATSYTFRWAGGDTSDGSSTAGILVRTFFDQKRGPRGGNTIVCVHNDAEKVTANAVGGIIKAAYQ